MIIRAIASLTSGGISMRANTCAGPCGGGAIIDRIGRRRDFGRYFLVHEQMRIGELGGLEFRVRNDDARVELGEAVQPHGEIMRHADAAMRRSMADTFAFVHGDAGPCDTLHVRHRRTAVDVRAVEDLFLNDAENAQRRRQARHSGRDRSIRDMHAIAIKVQLLLIDRNENLQRPFLNLAERLPVDAIGGFWFMGFMCSAMFVPAAVPVSGRCRRCGRGYDQARDKCDRVPAAAGAAAIPPKQLLVAPRACSHQCAPFNVNRS